MNRNLLCITTIENHSFIQLSNLSQFIESETLDERSGRLCLKTDSATFPEVDVNLPHLLSKVSWFNLPGWLIIGIVDIFRPLANILDTSFDLLIILRGPKSHFISEETNGFLIWVLNPPQGYLLSAWMYNWSRHNQIPAECPHSFLNLQRNIYSGRKSQVEAPKTASPYQNNTK